MSEQTSSRDVLYRGYRIYPGNTVFAAWHYIHEDYSGPEDNRGGAGATIEACKAEIDERIDEGLDDRYGWEGL